MRRVIALLASVAVASFVGVVAVRGSAVAQDAGGAGDSAAGDSAAADGTAGSGDAASGDAASGDAAPSLGDGTASAGTGASTASGSGEMDAGTYAVRLRDLEQRIDALKEQIFRSKARLSLLAETVLGGVVAGAQAIIIHENRMSSSYRLVKAVYALDGARLFSKADEEGSLGDQQEFEIFNGSIVPGEHNVSVNLEYRGHGYGIFSYLKGYRFRVRSSYSFTAPEGKAITIRVVGYEKGGPTAPLEERPAIRYIERVESTRRGGGEASDDAEGSGDE